MAMLRARTIALLAALGLSVPAAADTIEDHLRRGLAYRAAGDLASARLEFETVLNRQGLPPDLDQTVDAYARTAEAILAGKRLVANFFAGPTAGHYRENASPDADAADDLFIGARLGSSVTYTAADNLTLTANLDYLFRSYDAPDRSNDSELLWDLAANRNRDTTTLSAGVRGWMRHEGDGTTRNDYGVFTSLQLLPDANDQIELGVELRRRTYTPGPLDYRNRSVAEASIAWTHGFAGGRGSVGLTLLGGREYFRQDGVNDTSWLFVLAPEVNFTLSDSISAFASLWYQNSRFTIERYRSDTGNDVLPIPDANDGLYEIGGGLTWQFAPGWEAGPSILHIRETGGSAEESYRATEFSLTVRKDF
jgi:hypothetical protein